MSKKLGFYTLTNETIKSMKDLVKVTKETQKEFGSDLCANIKNELISRNTCSGSYCEVIRKCQCNDKEILAGGFHTHVRTPEPSLADLVLAMEYGIECIGSGKYNRINCYIIKKNIKSEDKNDILSKSSELLNKVRNVTFYDHVKMKDLEILIKKEYVDKFSIK